MAYEYERDEWRSAVRSLSETQREIAKDSRRRSLGIVGDPSDDPCEKDDTDDEEAGE